MLCAGEHRKVHVVKFHKKNDEFYDCDAGVDDEGDHDSSENIDTGLEPPKGECPLSRYFFNSP